MKSHITVAGKKLQIVTLDFETFYSQEYTLSGKLNTSEYIRDDRFHAHGVGIKVGRGAPKWYTGKNIALALKAIDWSKSALLCHNTAFDGFILSEHFDIVPAFYLDTLSMSRAVHGHHIAHGLDKVAKLHGLGGKVKEKALKDTKGLLFLSPGQERALGGYCLDDVNDTFTLFWIMYDQMPDDELELIDITLRMFCDPVLRIDIPRVQAELEKEVGGKVAALLKSSATPEDLISNNKFAKLLEQHIVVPTKMSIATGKRTFAFAKNDLAFQALLQHSNPQVRALAEARVALRSTIGETRAVRFLEAGKDNKPLPILLNYSGAHTHRWSGGNKMNLQNLKRGGELRRSILAPEGYSIVVADSAQIEARVLAWLAGQDDITQAFARKEDVYKLMASAIYGKHISEITKEERFIGKICVLGLGYGMGPEKLLATLKSGAMGPPMEVTPEQCRRMVDIYRSKNWAIKALWKSMDKMIASMYAGATGTFGPLKYGKGFIQLPGGLFLQYYGLHGTAVEHRGDLVTSEMSYLTRYGRSKLYGGLLTENIVQALSRRIIAEQMLRISKRYRIVTMTHDEIVVICKTEEADKCLEFMLEVMSTEPEWAAGLPLAAEGGHDVCYSK